MKRLYILLIICAAWLPLKAQVNVSIQILPPYPTKISDYASRPQLMVVAVTNTSTTNQRIQLRGAVTGDNGIELRVKDNYKSVSPIELGPGQVRMLNGNDLKYFFDYTRITYKGIIQNDFISKNGLPEGTYRFCIRAYNYDTNAPVSGDEPVGCSNTFTISSLEPPTIIAPAADASISSKMGQTILFSWTTPPGTSPQIMSSVRYRIRMVEVIGGRNSNNALMSATQPYFFDREIMGNNFVYGPGEPQLTPGRKYAFMVEASDPFNHTPFRNNGRSEVRSFTYAAQATIKNPLTPPEGTTQHPIMATVPTGLNCDCKANPGTGDSNNALVTPNAVVNVGNYKMHVASVKPGTNGTVSGEGTMELPFVGATPGTRLRVTFTNMDVDGQLKMKSGDVQGMISDNAASLIPTADDPNAPNMQMEPGDATRLQQYFSNKADQMLSSIKNSGNTVGFQLPLGISKGPVTIAISRVFFSATQAWFEAAAAVDIPDGGTDNVLALSGRNICLGTAEKAFCNDGQLYLSKDFNISALRLVLKGAGTNTNIVPGTSITFNDKGMTNFSIKAEYTFKDGTLTDAKTNQGLKVDFTAETTTGWTDWVATLQLPEFYVAGMNSIKFSLGGKQMYYDHSDIKNPQNIPPNFASPDGNGDVINTSLPTWHGFYIPEITVKMPSIIKNTQPGSDGTVGVQGKQLIFDGNGFTGTVQTRGKILELGNGSMDGWYASIDAVNLQFFKSGFKKSSLTGKVLLPASSNKTENQLDYEASLTTPGTGGIAYSFNIKPAKSDITFDAMLMTVALDTASYIRVSGDTNSPLKAEAMLNGTLSISNDPLSKIKVPGIGNLSLPHIQFNNLKFMSYPPYIGDGMVAKLTSGPTNNSGGSSKSSGFDMVPDEEWPLYSGPSANDANRTVTAPASQFDGGGDDGQQKVVGFEFTGKASDFKVSGGLDGAFSAGLTLTGGIAIGAGPITCQAEAAILFSSSIKKNNDGRIQWDGAKAAIQDISMAGGVDFGPFNVKGAIKYYNNVSANESDEGFVGALQTNLAGFLTLTMRGQFGTKTEMATKYHYFNFNALADFGQTGITFAPPVPLAIYGFGGGFYYNMAIVSGAPPKTTDLPHTPKTTDTDDMPKEGSANASNINADASPMDLLNYNPAGIVLKPSNGASGFNATILFGLTSRNTLDADATFGMDFSSSGGIEKVYIHANTRILTDVSKPLNERNAVSTGVGSLIIEYTPRDKIFLANLNAEFGLPHSQDTKILHATGGGQFYSNGNTNDWYLKIGQPEESGTPNTVTLLDFITGESYFEVGTMVDPMPGIPQRVWDLVGNGEHDQHDKLKKSKAASRGYTATGDMHGDHGVILGTAVKIGHEDQEYHFLMFFGTLDARMGFDLSLKEGVTCKGVPGAGGPGGWYAQGQAYFGAHASLGIDVNLFLIKAKFTIFEAGAAALVRGGLPNPTWAEGAIGGRFSILDGAIQSDFNFHFNVGDDPCIDAAGSPFGGLTLISQVLPAASDQKQPLSAMPAVVFNVKAGGTFKNSQYLSGYFDFDDYVNADEYGNPKKRLFLFDKSCITAKLNGNVITDDLVRLDKDGFSLGYQSPNYLPKNTEFNFRVEAKMHEGFYKIADVLNGVIAPTYDGFIQDDVTHADAMQHMESTFTTDNGFDAIPSAEYAMTAPLHSDKQVPLNEYGALPGNIMYIETKKVIENESFFTYPAGTTYKARIYRNGIRDGGDIPITMEIVTNRLNDGLQPNTNSLGNVIHSGADAHTRWSFKSPIMQKGSDYSVLIIAKTPSQNTGSGTPSTVLTSQQTSFNDVKVGGQAISGVAVTALVRKLGNNVNTLSSGESIAGGFNFHTSNFNTYNEKFAGMKISKIYFTEPVTGRPMRNNFISADHSQLENREIIKHWKLDTAGKYTINLGSGLSHFNFPTDVTFTGELFSKADIYGTNSDDVFQADYSKYGNGVPRNISIARLYKGQPQDNYGAAYINLRTFIANNIGVPVGNIKVNVNSPGQATDQGIIYCSIKGGGDTEYTGSQSNVGAKVPDKLPQQASNSMMQQTMSGLIPLTLPGLSLATPVIMSTNTASNKVCETRSQMTFTDPIQRQIDKLKNWAVNPGDNVSTPGNVMNNPGTNRSNVEVWESVGTATTTYMSGGLNQGQLEGAVKGAMNKAGQR